jgi:hypothetical protein
MNAMLRDVFNMHESRGNEFVSHMEVQLDVVKSVQDAVNDETARKYYNLRME